MYKLAFFVHDLFKKEDQSIHLIYQYLGLMPNEIYGLADNTSYALLFCRKKNDLVVDTQVYQVPLTNLPPMAKLGDILYPAKIYQKGQGDWFMTFHTKTARERFERLEAWQDINQKVAHVRNIQ